MKVICCVLAATALHAQAISDWAFGGPDHRLHYRTDRRGNGIMDFSSAGYRGGGVKLPAVIASERLTAATGDNTARIQSALDTATGAVVLAPGEYEIAGTLSITRRGVVLRGEQGASIRLTGKPHGFLEIRGTGTWHEEGPRVPILDTYVPAGANEFRIRDASAFHSGDRVLVLDQITTRWIRFMGMNLPARDGQPPLWLPSGGVIRTDRVVDSVEGDRVTLDVPLSDALDSQFTAASLVRYSFPGRITEAGVEGLRIVAAFEDIPISGSPRTTVRMDAVEDTWARDLEIQETRNAFEIGPAAKRVTLANVRITHSTAHLSSAATADFTLQGTQILLDRCNVTGESAGPVVTEAAALGPLVVLNFTAEHGGVAPHQPWATGLLVDGGRFPGGTENRPGVAFAAGSGHEWNIGWAVAWNVVSPFLLVQQPPGALNWCIGCVGTPVPIAPAPIGIFDSRGTMVAPTSLYLHQLQDRLGPDAVRSIGY
jgi:hypothetical protein